MPEPTAGQPGHHVPIADGTFAVWDQCVLRTAGMPFDWVTGLEAPALTPDPGAGPMPGEFAVHFARELRGTLERLRDAIRQPRFREAVAWQNPQLLARYVDAFSAGAVPERLTKSDRKKAMRLTRYLQRYCTKNETIGFFGPVAWAQLTDGHGLSVTTGARLLRSRSVHFESWAVDAVGAALVRRFELRPWLAPRRNPSVAVEGNRAAAPQRQPVLLDELSLVLLNAADGTRSAVALAEEAAWLGFVDPAAEDEVFERLDDLAQRRLLRWDLVLPLGSWPERDLCARLDAVGDSRLRDRARAEVDRLLAARDATHAAAGDADAVVRAVEELNTVFEDVTDAPSSRRPGEFAGGRTLVYEDAQRDVDVRVGGDLLARIGDALDLVLRSARWLTDRVAAHCREAADRCFDELRARGDGRPVRLSAMTLLLGPHLIEGKDLITDRAGAELRQRWWDILGPACGDGTAPVQVTSAELRDRVRAAFDCPGPGWTAARYHSPDLMLVTPDGARSATGALFVLGELHTAVNTLENRVYAAQHPDPESLTRRVAEDGLTGRIVPMLPKNWRAVTSRTFPPLTHLLPDYTYWSIGDDPGGAPVDDVLPAGGLCVERHDGRLLVRDEGGAFDADLVEVLGELLSMVTVDAFGMVPPLPHQPRIVVDNLVVARETWRVPIAGTGLTRSGDDAARFLAYQQFADRLGLPRRVFIRVTGERKPVYVDRRSPLLITSLLHLVRGAAERPNAELTVTEMLPDREHLWLPDADGDLYTSEFRLVAVDRAATR
ncbi:lantibiotic dehydratase family protein [Streptomyces sp. NBC_01591]|uniref:lantibiotic dehydratase n=1 Tax=Streptomyces sp. NBC_01591 TaxID=2975888 RepID=UPI002DD95BCE|nr:lantibiotic dehydratase [Streptomyces sp. NBC_01591]WSD71863.1 lantibiotic dehydratase family protein [Streptomyces sp. NBC_01591]